MIFRKFVSLHTAVLLKDKIHKPVQNAVSKWCLLFFRKKWHSSEYMESLDQILAFQNHKESLESNEKQRSYSHLKIHIFRNFTGAHFLPCHTNKWPVARKKMRTLKIGEKMKFLCACNFAISNPILVIFYDLESTWSALWNLRPLGSATLLLKLETVYKKWVAHWCIDFPL